MKTLIRSLIFTLAIATFSSAAFATGKTIRYADVTITPLDDSKVLLSFNGPKSDEDLKLTILTAKQKVVNQFQINTSDNKSLVVNLNSINTGVYFMDIPTGEDVIRVEIRKRNSEISVISSGYLRKDIMAVSR
jgi:hypothetical protein